MMANEVGARRVASQHHDRIKAVHRVARRKAVPILHGFGIRIESICDQVQEWGWVTWTRPCVSERVCCDVSKAHTDAGIQKQFALDKCFTCELNGVVEPTSCYFVPVEVRDE